MRGNISSLQKLANFHPSGPSPLPPISPRCIEKQTGPFLQRFPWSHSAESDQVKYFNRKSPLLETWDHLVMVLWYFFYEKCRNSNRHSEQPIIVKHICRAVRSNNRIFESSKVQPRFTWNFFQYSLWHSIFSTKVWRQSSHCNCNYSV